MTICQGVVVLSTGDVLWVTTQGGSKRRSSEGIDATLNQQVNVSTSFRLRQIGIRDVLDDQRLWMRVWSQGERMESEMWRKRLLCSRIGTMKSDRGRLGTSLKLRPHCGHS